MPAPITPALRQRPRQRHAWLIIAYDNFRILDRQLRLLDDPRNSIHLHIDAKVRSFDPALLARICRHATVHFVPRVPVYWGDYSQIEAVFRALRSAMAEPHDYYHLLSGADFPLRTQDEIHDFFERHAGREFVGFAHDFDRRWVSEIQLMTHHLRPTSRVEALVQRTVSQSFIRMQRMVRYDHSRRFGLTLKKGSDWYSISHALASHLLANEALARRLLKRGYIPSEFLVQTLVWNSPFRDRVHDPEDEFASSLRLIDWQRGSPYVFRSSDFDELVGSGRLIARKFSEKVDFDVVERLYAHLKARQA